MGEDGNYACCPIGATFDGTSCTTQGNDSVPVSPAQCKHDASHINLDKAGMCCNKSHYNSATNTCDSQGAKIPDKGSKGCANPNDTLYGNVCCPAGYTSDDNASCKKQTTPAPACQIAAALPIISADLAGTGILNANGTYTTGFNTRLETKGTEGLSGFVEVLVKKDEIAYTGVSFNQLDGNAYPLMTGETSYTGPVFQVEGPLNTGAYEVLFKEIGNYTYEIKFISEDGTVYDTYNGSFEVTPAPIISADLAGTGIAKADGTYTTGFTTSLITNGIQGHTGKIIVSFTKNG
jgi:hypothetical protein